MYVFSDQPRATEHIAIFVKTLYSVTFVFNAATNGGFIKTMIANRLMSKIVLCTFVKNLHLVVIVINAATNAGGFT